MPSMLPITKLLLRMSACRGSLLQQEGLEPVVQAELPGITTISGLQSDILGRQSGLTNILCLTGDHQSFGNHPEAKNLDSIQLIHTARMMRMKVDSSAMR